MIIIRSLLIIYINFGKTNYIDLRVQIYFFGTKNICTISADCKYINYLRVVIYCSFNREK